MRTSYWLSILGWLLLFFVAFELNRSDNLGQAMWTGYVTLAVVMFTICWMGLMVVAGVWVYKLAVRGHIEQNLDLVRAAETRWERFNNQRFNNQQHANR